MGRTNVLLSLKKYILTCPLCMPTTAPMRVGAWRMCTRSPMDREGQRMLFPCVDLGDNVQCVVIASHSILQLLFTSLLHKSLKAFFV